MLSSSESDERLRADGRRCIGRIGGKSSGVGAVVVHVGRRSNLVAQTSDRTSRSGRDAIKEALSSSERRRAPDGLGPVWKSTSVSVHPIILHQVISRR